MNPDVIGSTWLRRSRGSSTLTWSPDKLFVGLLGRNVLLLDGLLQVGNGDLVRDALALQVGGDVGEVARPDQDVDVRPLLPHGGDVGWDGCPVVLNA